MIAGLASAVFMLTGAGIPWGGMRQPTDCVLSVSAETETSGVCDAATGALQWALDASGTLTISGEGKMKSWTSALNVPWASVKDQIKKAVVEEGVSNIGRNAFNGCIRLSDIVLSQSVTVIESQAFYGCSNLTMVTIPSGVQSIYSIAFQDCVGLAKIKIMNPQCEIFGGTGDTIPRNAVIAGYADSTAQNFAEQYQRSFELIAGTPETTAAMTTTTTTQATTTTSATKATTTTSATKATTTTSATKATTTTSATKATTTTSATKATTTTSATKATTTTSATKATTTTSATKATTTTSATKATTTTSATKATTTTSATKATTTTSATKATTTTSATKAATTSAVTTTAVTQPYENYEGVVPDQCNIIADQIYAKPGETVPFSIYLMNNPGFSVLNIMAAYSGFLDIRLSDEKKADIIYGPVLDGAQVLPASSPYSPSYNYSIAVLGNHVNENDGVLVTVYFTVPEDAVPGGEYDVLLPKAALMHADGKVIETNAVQGWIRVVQDQGDVNSDGAVNSLDAQQVLAAAVNQLSGNPPGLSSAQQTAADVDDNKKVDALDAQFILRYYLESQMHDKTISWSDIVSGK
ncbi:MAG: leucine-rich repeat protein [Oscillospiraceae bacterium]|nr:leucine-rich repeat protein [Oscillospiraceae bacterium]